MSAISTYIFLDERHLLISRLFFVFFFSGNIRVNDIESQMKMDENDQDVKSPMKRVGSTRKVFLFNNIRQQLNEHLRCLGEKELKERVYICL